MEARGLLGQIDLKFVGLLVSFTKIFGEVKFLSDVLQSPQLNLGTAVTLVDSLVDTLSSLREGVLFDEIWEKTVTLAEQCNIGAAPPGRQVTPSSSLAGYYISTPIVQKQGNTDKESFCKGSFIQLLMCFSLR